MTSTAQDCPESVMGRKSPSHRDRRRALSPPQSSATEAPPAAAAGVTSQSAAYIERLMTDYGRDYYTAVLKRVRERNRALLARTRQLSARASVAAAKHGVRVRVGEVREEVTGSLPAEPQGDDTSAESSSHVNEVPQAQSEVASPTPGRHVVTSSDGHSPNQWLHTPEAAACATPDDPKQTATCPHHVISADDVTGYKINRKVRPKVAMLAATVEGEQRAGGEGRVMAPARTSVPRRNQKPGFWRILACLRRRKPKVDGEKGGAGEVKENMAERYMKECGEF